MFVVFVYPDRRALIASGISALQAASVGEGRECLYDPDLYRNILLCRIYHREKERETEIFLGSGDGGAVFCGAVCGIRYCEPLFPAAFIGFYNNHPAVHRRRHAGGNAELMPVPVHIDCSAGVLQVLPGYFYPGRL